MSFNVAYKKANQVFCLPVGVFYFTREVDVVFSESIFRANQPLLHRHRIPSASQWGRKEGRKLTSRELRETTDDDDDVAMAFEDGLDSAILRSMSASLVHHPDQGRGHYARGGRSLGSFSRPCHSWFFPMMMTFGSWVGLPDTTPDRTAPEENPVSGGCNNLSEGQQKKKIT